MVAPPIFRIWLAVGHGLSNATPGVYDSGAVSCYGTEHEIVAAVADQVLSYYDIAHTDQMGPATNVTVVEVPPCSGPCLERHAKKIDGDHLVPVSHLSYQIHYLNENFHRFDFIVSLHMNESAGASGVMVVYDDGAPPARMRQALAAAAALSRVLGIENRGVMMDRQTPRRHIGILENTKAPSLLFELGFINNETDVAAVKARGRDAVIAAIEAIRGVQ